MDLNTKEAQSLRRRIKRTVTQHSLSSIELSELVWQTRYAQVQTRGQTKTTWEHWGHESWEGYLLAELQMSLVLARAHIRVWDAFGIALKGKWDKSKAMPHAKMSALAELAVTSKDVDGLLDEASKLTLQEVWELNPQKSRKRKTTLLLTKRELGKYRLYINTIRVMLGIEEKNRGAVVLEALEHYLAFLQKKGKK